MSFLNSRLFAVHAGKSTNMSVVFFISTSFNELSELNKKEKFE